MLQGEAFRDTVDRFVALGLEADVAETYLHVLTRGAMRPGGLATALRISRGEAYRRLERLAAMDLATGSQHRPIVYEPAEPARVFELLHRDAAQQAEEVQAVMSELEPYTPAFSGWDTAIEGRTFRYLTGRSAYYAEVHRLLDHAEKEVLIVNTHSAGAELADRVGLWDRIEHCQEHGVQWRAVLAHSPAIRQHLDFDRIRLLRTGNILRFLIAERKSIILCIANDASGTRDAPLEKYLLTGAPGFLAARMLLFERLWSRGSRLEAKSAMGNAREPAPPARPNRSHTGDLLP